MAVHFQVRADVVDIQADRPRPSDAVLVDSNVWFWMTYLGPGVGTERRARVYPAYVKQARRAKARLFRCGLSLAELAHGIEQAEYDIFAQTHPLEKLKEFRHNYSAERDRIATDVTGAWRIVKSMAAPLALAIDERCTDSALGRFPAQLLDGYDLFMAEAMAAAGIRQVLTDDGDFCTVPGIEVFTANRQTIDAARAQGKLLVRGAP